MAGPHELFNFVTKFCNLWQAGAQAHLFVECQAGDAYINLQLKLGHQPPPPPPSQQGQHHHPRQPGPSRLRRRARRAQARSIAADNAVQPPPVSTDAAVQAAATIPTTETAVQVVTETMEAAVQTIAPVTTTAENAVEGTAPPELADHVQHHPRIHAAQAGLHVHDEFCPDETEVKRVDGTISSSRAHYQLAIAAGLLLHRPPPDLQSDHHLPGQQHHQEAVLNNCQGQIPQLDGCTLDMSNSHLSQLKCADCHKLFETKEQLSTHDENNEFGCDECYICFKTKHLADMHELASHPSTYYALHHIAPSTMQEFARRNK